MKILKLPGFIDIHVHLREPGGTHKENFETGTQAAIAGGYTTIIDMPNNSEPTITTQALEDKFELAKGRVYCDLGFHFGGTPASIEYFKEIYDRVYGLKVYMNHTTGNLLVDQEEDIELIFKSWPHFAKASRGKPAGKPILAHAESRTLEIAIRMAKKYNQRLHVCHMSLAEEVEMVKKAKNEGLNITCEVTPHHLFLNENDVERLGTYGLMKPPLGSKKDQDALWENINIIDVIGSDHAPHLKDEKNPTAGSGLNPPFGVPNLDTTLSLMITAVNDGRLTLDKAIDMCAIRPREIFNIPKQSDTFVEVEVGETWTIEAKNLKTKCGWSPFEGMSVSAKVRKTVLRGQEVYDGEKIIGEPTGLVI
ncbi:MAG TPA: dihydroorotase family protein [Patescibacteria group bacterium]|nr:dihydroorotase family protein [Patescibacteria group bacterium]